MSFITFFLKRKRKTVVRDYFFFPWERVQGNFLGWGKDICLDICSGCKVVYTCKLSTSCILMILHKQKIKAYSEISLIFYLKAINFWHFEMLKQLWSI